MEWIEITEQKQVDQLVDLSQEYKVVIFKHSTSCGISRMVLRNFEMDVKTVSPDDVHFFFLDLLSYRSISNYIAEKFNVIHQSPQMIMLNKGAVIYSASHSNISLEALA